MTGDARPFSLTDNPFAQLGLTPRASREQIEERGGRNHALAQVLLDPFKRLTEELAWLPGASGQAAQETVQALAAHNAATVMGRLVLLRGLAKANLAADAALRFGDADLVDQMIRAWDAVDLTDVVSQVNADRMISGFPQVNGPQVDWGLQSVRQRHGATAAALLAETDAGRERLLRLIERPAPSGQDADLRLIDAVVSAYSDVVVNELNQKETAILNEVDAMTRGGRDGLERLEGLFASWERVNRPALLLARRRGREDERTLALVGDIRTLYLDPSAGAGRIGPAGRIANLLLGLFPDAPAIQRMAAGDAARLGAVVQGPQAIAERPTLTAASAAAQSQRGESKATRTKRQANVKARDAARQAAQAEDARKRLADQQRQRAAADWNNPQQRKPAAAVPVSTAATTATAAEAAREALIAQVRARVEAAGETPAGVPQKKKGGCGWIIPVAIGGFLLVRCINNLPDETTQTTTQPPRIEPPAVIEPPSPLPDARPGAPVDTGRPQNYAPTPRRPYIVDESRPPEEGSTGGGGGRR